MYNSYRFDSDVLGLLPLIALGRYSVDVLKLHCMLCMDAVLFTSLSLPFVVNM